MPQPALAALQAGPCHFCGMPDAMTIAAPGFPAAAASSSQAASPAAGDNAPAAGNSASAPQASTPVPLDRPGFILAYNPNAPFANLQDLVTVPDAGPQAAITGALQAANGAPASPVVYRIASHLYRSLQER
jgi:hypothetical protein